MGRYGGSTRSHRSGRKKRASEKRIRRLGEGAVVQAQVGAVKKRYYRCIVWFPLLWLSPLSFGQAVKIRIVNANHGQPLPKQKVSVALLYEKGEVTPANYDTNLKLETDGNGEVQFILPEPAPVHFAVRVRLTSKHWHCKCVALVSTQVAIEQGIVQTPGPELSKSATSAGAGPGVVLFIARPFTFLERMNPFARGQT